LRRHKHDLAIEASTAHQDAVVEGAGEIELGEVRAYGVLLGSEELDNAFRVEQPGDALAGGGFVPIRPVRPSRRALWALLRMRINFDSIKKFPHPEEAARAAV
jgi:hypothetical protein